MALNIEPVFTAFKSQLYELSRGLLTESLFSNESNTLYKNMLYTLAEMYFEASDIVSDVYSFCVGHSMYHIRHFECHQLLFHYGHYVCENVGHVR